MGSRAGCRRRYGDSMRRGEEGILGFAGGGRGSEIGMQRVAASRRKSSGIG